MKSIYNKKQDVNNVDIGRVGNFLDLFYYYNRVPKKNFDVSEVCILSKSIRQNPTKYVEQVNIINKYLSSHNLIFNAAISPDAFTLMCDLVNNIKLKQRIGKLNKI